METKETGGIEHGGGESLGRCRPEFAGDPAVARDAVPVGEAVARVLERIEDHLRASAQWRFSQSRCISAHSSFVIWRRLPCSSSIQMGALRIEWAMNPITMPAMVRVMIVAMGQAAFERMDDRSTPCFLASFVIASTRQFGIFDPFQLDTVDGVSFSARATATVPPSASMMSAAFCMAYCYDNRNLVASG